MAVIIDLLLVYLVYFLTRVAYLLENRSYFENLTSGELVNIFGGGLLFDTSAIFYTNALWIVMVLFPLHWKETTAYHKVCRWVFVVINGLAAVMNLADSVYFAYTLRRSTSTLFSEFSNESNLGSIVGVELLNHWYLLLLAVLLIVGLWKAYRTPGFKPVASWRYYLTSTLMLAALVILAIGGIRGGFTKAVRQQCQPVRSQTHRGGPCIEYAFLDDPYHRQGCVQGSVLFRHRGGNGSRLHAYPSSASVRHRCL